MARTSKNVRLHRIVTTSASKVDPLLAARSSDWDGANDHFVTALDLNLAACRAAMMEQKRSWPSLVTFLQNAANALIGLVEHLPAPVAARVPEVNVAPSGAPRIDVQTMLAHVLAATRGPDDPEAVRARRAALRSQGLWPELIGPPDKTFEDWRAEWRAGWGAEAHEPEPEAPKNPLNPLHPEEEKNT